jgi:hypothetical protein
MRDGRRPLRATRGLFRKRTARLLDSLIVAPQQRNFCSCIGTAHFHLRQPGTFLALRTGLGTFYKHSIFEPGEPRCANACGFFNGGRANRKRPRRRETPRPRWGGATRECGLDLLGSNRPLRISLRKPRTWTGRTLRP